MHAKEILFYSVWFIWAVCPVFSTRVSEPKSFSSKKAGGANLCRCGRGKPTRIVGGTLAQEGEFPWRAFIYVTTKDNSPYGCGATILSPRWVLTATHCLEPDLIDVVVHAGCVVDRESKPIQVDQVLSHEGYNGTTYDNDISLLHLTEDLDFENPNIMPICLPYGMDPEYNAEGTVLASGWGSMEEGGDVTSLLRKVSLQMISNARCKDMHDFDVLQDGSTITNTKLCAFALAMDTCQGDSGGSIDWQDSDGTFYALGIVSNGHGCAREGMPGVYTRITEFLPWIEKKTGVTFCRNPNRS